MERKTILINSQAIRRRTPYYVFSLLSGAGDRREARRRSTHRCTGSCQRPLPGTVGSVTYETAFTGVRSAEKIVTLSDAGRTSSRHGLVFFFSFVQCLGDLPFLVWQARLLRSLWEWLTISSDHQRNRPVVCSFAAGRAGLIVTTRPGHSL